MRCKVIAIVHVALSLLAQWWDCTCSCLVLWWTPDNPQQTGKHNPAFVPQIRGTEVSSTLSHPRVGLLDAVSFTSRTTKHTLTILTFTFVNTHLSLRFTCLSGIVISLTGSWGLLCCCCRLLFSVKVLREDESCVILQLCRDSSYIFHNIHN